MLITYSHTEVLLHFPISAPLVRSVALNNPRFYSSPLELQLKLNIKRLSWTRRIAHLNSECISRNAKRMHRSLRGRYFVHEKREREREE